MIEHIDDNGDGYLTRDEFVEGCLEDEEFMSIVGLFDGRMVWGELFVQEEEE
jgi:hypothetical protein